MKNISKNKLIFLLSCTVLSFVFLIFSVSYAWFNNRVNGSVNGSTSIKVGNLAVKFTEGSKINVTNGSPIYDTNKATGSYKNTFTITHDTTGNLAACYNVSLVTTKINSKFKSEFFKYELVNTATSSVVASGNFTSINAGTEKALLSGVSLPLGSSHSYELRIWLSYSDTVDQSTMLTGNTSSVFEGNIKVYSKVDGTC